MITFIKSWCEGIIVAVMLSIIIEMLLPEGNNKKYVKVVVGIYILFVIIGPILEKINTGYTLETFFEFDTIEVSADVDENIKDVYIDGIEETIKNELIESGYFVEKVSISVDNNYENIEKIEIELSSENNRNNNEIQIDSIVIGENQVIEKENIELKNMLAENYQVPIEKIYIFQN